jgi:hypothetical protein
MTKAWAHTTDAGAEAFGWSVEPPVVVPLAVLALLYLAGSCAGAAKRTGEGSGPGSGSASPVLRSPSARLCTASPRMCSQHT